jgi:hypothetical protein
MPLRPFRSLADVRRHSFKCELEKNQMRKTLMVSVAVAALFAATGLATAQGVNQGAGKARSLRLPLHLRVTLRHR